MADTTMSIPYYREPRLDHKPTIRLGKDDDDDQWLNIKAIIAAIAVPKPTNAGQDTFSQETTPVDDSPETSHLLPLPKVIDVAEPTTAAYGTFTPNPTAKDAPEAATAHTVLPLHPTTLLASASLTPVYLLLMLLPLLPFWIFAGFLVYVAATSPLADIYTLLLALAVLIPFNLVGTAAIVRFALSERAKALGGADGDVESGGLSSRRSSGGSVGSGEKEHYQQRLWRPSMRFVLSGTGREARRGI